MATSQQQGPPCRLLQLPGELRNRIYRYAITGSTATAPIQITNMNIPEPGLLRTCKQIRAETLPIYFCENTFQHNIFGFDSNVAMLWQQKLRAMTARDQVVFYERPPLILQLHPPHHWKNLKEWARRLHSQELLLLTYQWFQNNPPPGAVSFAAERVLITAVLETAVLLRSAPWNVVEKLLEITHTVLTTLDVRWQ